MVNVYKLGLTVLQQEILRLMFVKAGATLNQRQIAKLLGITAPAVIKALPALETRDLLTLSQDKVSRRWSIGLNRNNHRVLQLKRADNLRQAYDSGLVDFLEKEFAGATIVLFGSYSRGEDTIDSDIDVAVIGRKDKLIDVVAYENCLERPINVNCYKDLKSVHRNLRENIFNGITLAGGFTLAEERTKP